MSDPSAPIRLFINYFPIGWHEAIWHGRDDAAALTTQYESFKRVAQTAEAAKLDGLFLADQIGGLNARSARSLWGALDPTVHLGAIAEATSNIGLVSTVSGVFGTPAEVARKIATLNHLSAGRAAWNIVTSQSDSTRAVFGHRDRLEDADRYRRADEFAQIVTAFWRSLPEDAFVADAANGRYVDADRTRPVDFDGEHFSAGGVLPLSAGPDGERPLIFQAGASDTGIDYGVRWADVLFTARRTLESARGFYADVHERAARIGRPAPLVLPGVFLYPGRSEAEAIAHKRELDDRLDYETDRGILASYLGLEPEAIDLDRELPYDLVDTARVVGRSSGLSQQIIGEASRNGWTARQVIQNNGLGAHRVIVGDGEEIAKELLSWVDAKGADGFVISFGDYEHDLPAFAETGIPYLQKQGRFRTEYDAERTTLRQNLGLAGQPDPLLTGAAQ